MELKVEIKGKVYEAIGNTVCSNIRSTKLVYAFIFEIYWQQEILYKNTQKELLNPVEGYHK